MKAIITTTKALLLTLLLTTPYALFSEEPTELSIEITLTPDQPTQTEQAEQAPFSSRYAQYFVIEKISPQLFEKILKESFYEGSYLRTAGKQLTDIEAILMKNPAEVTINDLGTIIWLRKAPMFIDGSKLNDNLTQYIEGYFPTVKDFKTLLQSQSPEMQASLKRANANESRLAAELDVVVRRIEGIVESFLRSGTLAEWRKAAAGLTGDVRAQAELCLDYLQRAITIKTPIKKLLSKIYQARINQAREELGLTVDEAERRAAKPTLAQQRGFFASLFS